VINLQPNINFSSVYCATTKIVNYERPPALAECHYVLLLVFLSYFFLFFFRRLTRLTSEVLSWIITKLSHEFYGDRDYTLVHKLRKIGTEWNPTGSLFAMHSNFLCLRCQISVPSELTWTWCQFYTELKQWTINAILEILCKLLLYNATIVQNTIIGINRSQQIPPKWFSA